MFSGLIIASCHKTEMEEYKPNTEGLMMLGKKLENPYSVANMQQAYSNLKASKADVPDFSIVTTHLYVRFLPKNMDELELLEDDTTLELSEIPFDYDISEDGYYFHDMDLPIDGPTWQYAAVEEENELPNIKHEVLEELFLPPTPEELTKSYSDKWIEFFDLLEHEALKITGNLEGDTELKTNKGSEWKPKGRITLWDDVANDYVPIEHVVVQARRWFRTISGITNADGYYECNGYFNRAANYSIAWNRYNFSVSTNDMRSSNDPFYYPATFGSKKTRVKGPKKIGDWNLYLQKNSVSHFNGNIFRAAAQYYYGDINGLKRPPLNTKGQPKMRIIASLEIISSSSSDEYLSNEPNVYAVHTPDAGAAINPHWIEIYFTYLNSDELYGLVMRQLAYASLYDMNQGEFGSRDDAITISWGLGVELFLARKKYPFYSLNYSRYLYTGIVEDLTDGFKTTSSNYFGDFLEFGYKEYKDSVSGYSITQIEESLNGVLTIEEFLEGLKNNYANETEDKMDAAFRYWFYCLFR